MTLTQFIEGSQKFGFIDNANFWISLRQTRNAIANEYPDNLEKLVIDLNAVYTQSEKLLAYWQKLKTRIDQVVS